MSLATLSSIEKTFGPRVLFQDLSLMVYPGERIGLIGDNGSGKTTLFKVLTGQVAIDSGTVAIAKGTRVGYLTQDPTFDPANTVIDEAELAFAALHEISHRLRDVEHQMAGLEGEELEKILRQYQNLQHEFELAGGYAWRHRLEATLLGVGLDRIAWGQNVTTLSGGQKSRLALAKLLIGGADLLLLDEPTNHLDLAAIQWLEKYLLDFNGAVLLISHDRYLLDRLVTRIVWLNQEKLQSFPGNYSSFVQQRDLQELTQQRAYTRQQADIEKQAEFIRRFGAGQRSKEAKGREKRLNRLLKSDALLQQVAGRKHIHLSLSTDQRAGDQVLTSRELGKSYGEKNLWRGVNILVRRGERIGIIGPNGSGKTTLLRVLLGHEEADDGEARWGANLGIGYYDQRLDDYDPDSSVFDEVREGRQIKDQFLRNVLATMLFRGDDVHKPMGLLSGGERARVALAKLLVDRPNVLVMDEPTNHLDIASREALEGALKDFEGTILCASHDRYFLEKIAGRIWIVRDGLLTDFDGKFSEWVLKQQQLSERQAGPGTRRRSDEATRQRSDEEKPATPRKDNPYLRPFGRLTVEELESQITETEETVADCEKKFADPATFRDGAGKDLQDHYEQACKKLEQLEEEYFMREG